jgi:hypothetical protein
MSQKINWVFIPYDKKKMFPPEKILTPSPGHNDVVLFFTATFMVLLVPEVYFFEGQYGFWKWVIIFFGNIFISLIVTTFFLGILHEHRVPSIEDETAAKELVKVLKEREIVLAN